LPVADVDGGSDTNRMGDVQFAEQRDEDVERDYNDTAEAVATGGDE